MNIFEHPRFPRQVLGRYAHFDTPELARSAGADLGVTRGGHARASLLLSELPLTWGECVQLARTHFRAAADLGAAGAFEDQASRTWAR